MKEHLATVTEDGMCLFVHEVIPQNTKKINIPCRKQLVVHKHFSHVLQKYLKEKKSLHLAQKYACVFFFLHSLFLKAHISEPITLADKYPCIFLCQIKAIITKHGNCLVAPWGRGGLIQRVGVVSLQCNIERR